MNTKTDEGLYEKARKLFISKASIDEFAGWATPVLLQCLFDRFGSVFPQCGLMVFPGAVIVSR